MSPSSSKLVRLFLAGLLAAFPLIATALLIAFVVGIVIRWLGPSSAVGSVMAKMGLGIAGFEWVGYVIGLAIVILALLILGLLVEKGLQKGFTAIINGLVRKIPVVRTVYDTIHSFVSLVAKRDDEELKTGMGAFWWGRRRIGSGFALIPPSCHGERAGLLCSDCANRTSTDWGRLTLCTG